ncbi:hypothetical protein L3i23_24380 [Herbiconiux sp. L3-i23]|nr:hypothetical protein L3i23_24380 [Herbiconiux sp. L3-i23]
MPHPTPTTDMPTIAASMPESCIEGTPEEEAAPVPARSRGFGVTATGSDSRVLSTARVAAIVSS